MFNKVIAEIAKAYTIIQESAQSVVFSAGGKTFAVCESHTGLTVYLCYQQNGEFVFLPGCKQGKSFKAVTNFVNARTAY